MNNQARRVNTGAMKLTPVLGVQKVTNLQTLLYTLVEETLKPWSKWINTIFVQMHHMETRLDEPILEKYKQSSFVHQGNKLQRQYQADLNKKIHLKPTLSHGTRGTGL